MGLFDGGSGGDATLDAIKRNQKSLAQIPDPDLQWTDYSPEVLEMVMMNPELIEEDAVIRGKQLSALEQLAQRGQEGLTLADKAVFEEGKAQSNQQARQNREAILQNAVARGVSGGGLEFALKEQANQEAAERARRSAMTQAAESARQKAMAQQAYFGALGNQRGQDFTGRSANAEIINRMNQLNTGAMNQAGQYNVGQRNFAQQYNVGGRNDLEQQRFNNAMTRFGAQSGLQDQQARAKEAKRQAAAGQLAGIGSLVGTGIGAMYGGPTGAMVGSQVGSSAGGILGGM